MVLALTEQQLELQAVARKLVYEEVRLDPVATTGSTLVFLSAVVLISPPRHLWQRKLALASSRPST
jgi:hypothetical protein